MLRPRSQNSLGKKENKGKSQRHISEDEVEEGDGAAQRVGLQVSQTWSGCWLCPVPALCDLACKLPNLEDRE